MGSTVAIVVTVIALVLGFLILRNINDDDSDSSGGSGAATCVDTTPDSGLTTTTVGSTTTTTTPLVTEGSSVLVANCSTQNGVAGQMSTALASVGFTMAEPTNGTVKLATSKVLYNPDDPNAKPVADSVAQLLGGLAVEPTGVPIPAGDGNWPANTGVLLMLGDDLAGKTLDQIAGNPTTGTTAAPTTAGAVTTTT
jgi:predicted permease